MVGSCHHNTLRNSNVVLLTRSAIGAWNTASFRCKNVCRTATKLTFVVLWNVCTNDISKKIPTAFQIYHRRGFAIRVGMLIWQGEEIEKSPSANLFVYQQSTITMHTKYTNKLNRTMIFPTRYFPTFNCIDATHSSANIYSRCTHARTPTHERLLTARWTRNLDW